MEERRAAFDAVYICTPWDYPKHSAEFMRVLEDIDASDAVLLNDLSIVRWNLDKSYMQDVAARGGEIVPSTWYEGFRMEDAPGFFTDHDTDKVVIKPTIGGSATDTYVLTNPIDDALLASLATFGYKRNTVQKSSQLSRLMVCSKLHGECSRTSIPCQSMAVATGYGDPTGVSS